jgi:hypothetical protein
MRRYCKLASVCVAFLLVGSLPALADSNHNFSNVQLQRASDAVSGSFTFNRSTDQLSNSSLWFAGSLFGGVKVSDPNGVNGTKLGQDWLFGWSTQKSGDTIWGSVLFNPLTNQSELGESISNWKGDGKSDFFAVPEGGTPLSYLMLSGLAIFAGILISGKQRRPARTAQPS